MLSSTQPLFLVNIQWFVNSEARPAATVWVGSDGLNFAILPFDSISSEITAK